MSTTNSIIVFVNVIFVLTSSTGVDRGRNDFLEAFRKQLEHLQQQQQDAPVIGE